jgi:ubiquinone/menaquinone biosynthesis C-methylase UbiE
MLNIKDESYIKHRQARIAHWDSVARKMEDWRGWGAYYHARLNFLYKFLTTAGQRVLEIGCGEGDLLAALEPSLGVGVDFSAEMIRRARKRHSNLFFVQADAHTLPLGQSFDFIILSDLLNDVWDVQAVLEETSRLSHPRTRLIINLYSQLWEIPLNLATGLGLAKPNLEQNWLTVEDTSALLNLANFETIRAWQEIIFPLPIPFITPFLNRFLARIWPFRHLALTNFIVARPKPSLESTEKEPDVSVIIPARNESGNIDRIFARVPALGRRTELIFVEGHSADNTYDMIENAIQENPDRKCRLLQQPGEGKGDAVRFGFAHATGDILMILDADLTVPAEDLSRFYDVLRSGKGEFANGVRLVYPLEDEAMRYLNLVGNKFFGLAFSWLLGQPIKDTLCGTKALWREDYRLIEANRAYFGDFDPFGDFDLLLGAVKQNRRIIDVPIRYRARTYGATNIQRWRHGVLLLRMVLFAARRLKFI